MYDSRLNTAIDEYKNLRIEAAFEELVCKLQKFADFLVLSTSKRPLIRDPGQWNEKGQLRILDKYFPIHCFHPLYSQAR